MDTIKHLTENQLLAFAAGLLEKSESSEIGGHLLQCAACRNQLPAPTPQNFLVVLMGENELEEFEKKPLSLLTLFPFLQPPSRKPWALGWSVGSLVIILGFAFLIWFAAGNELSNESEVAQVFDMEIAEIKQHGNTEQIPTMPGNNSGDEMPISSVEKNRNVVNSKPTALKTDLPKRELKLPDKISQPKRNILSKEKANISLTRGGSSKCGEDNLVEMELVSKDKAITFRWKKVENAVKYHLYISDDEEILIDEYETDQETVYELKKMLDPARTYKWKVIITLENGQTASGVSQKFTVKDVLQNQKKLIRNKKSGIRCSEKK